MMRIVLSFFLFIIGLFTLANPTNLSVDGAISDFFKNDKNIVVSTLNGKVITLNSKTKKVVSTIVFDKVSDHFGDKSAPEVYHIEPAGDSIIALVRSQNGKNDIYLIHNHSKHLLIEGIALSSIIVDIRSIGKDKILIGLLSNEIILFNLVSKTKIYSVQISPYIFSTFTTSNDGKFTFVADESGNITKISTFKGTKISTYKGIHKDNVLSLAFGDNLLVGGSKDRNVSMYFIQQNKMRHVLTNHFVVIVAASKNGKFIGWYDDLKNEMVIYSVDKWQIIKRLNGYNSMITSILIENDRQITYCDEDGKIIINSF